MEDEIVEKPNRPPNDDFRQQKLKAWQPIMTPFKVVVIFVAIGVAFIPTGITILNASNKIYETRIMYDGADQVVDCSISKPNQKRRCNLVFDFDEDVEGPLFVYYELENFYQNHRKYVNSRDPGQLGGKDLAKSALELSCISDVESKTPNGTMILNPCGLIANSFFTDIITHNSSIDGYEMVESDIAWLSDRDKFIQPEGFTSCMITPFETCSKCVNCKNYTDSSGVSYRFSYPKDETVQYLYETYPDQISPIDGVTDPHFMVWMRTAALPNFRKLYGIIDGNFKKGQILTFQVTANFWVEGFSGSKSLLISNLGEFGGKNPYLGIAYIVVGSICLMFATLFGVKQLLSPRAVADPSLLNWN